jgi:hypothetical protein
MLIRLEYHAQNQNLHSAAPLDIHRASAFTAGLRCESPVQAILTDLTACITTTRVHARIAVQLSDIGKGWTNCWEQTAKVDSMSVAAESQELSGADLEDSVADDVNFYEDNMTGNALQDL